MEPANYFEFGDWILDKKEARLFRCTGEHLVLFKVEAQKLAILECLVEHASNNGTGLLTKDQLIAKAWGGASTSDSNVSASVSRLRTILQDVHATPKYIKTEHRKGFRFLANVVPSVSKPLRLSLYDGDARNGMSSTSAIRDRTESVALMREKGATGSLTQVGSHRVYTDFVGREHVFAAIDRFLHNHPRGYFIIEGDPGVGKSAIAEEFSMRTGCLVHANSRALGIDTTEMFLSNICTQLIEKFALAYGFAPGPTTYDGASLTQLLADAAAANNGSPVVLMIDALDEVRADRRNSSGNILGLPASLPDGIFFVLTKRRVTIPLAVREPIDVLDLMRFNAEGKHDVERFVRRVMDTRRELRAWAQRQAAIKEDFVLQLTNKSQGNFMYAQLVLFDVANGHYEGVVDFTSLPVGLQAYYERHWEQMGMTREPLPRTRLHVLYVLSAVARPVSRHWIAQFAAKADPTIDELATQAVLDDWRQFLTEQTVGGSKLYSLYHESFRDFLHRRDIVQAAGIVIHDINGMIADRLWGEVFEDESEDGET